MKRKGEGMMKSKGAVFGLAILILLTIALAASISATPYIGQWVVPGWEIVLGFVGLFGLMFGVAYKDIMSKEIFGEIGKGLVYLTGIYLLLVAVLGVISISLPVNLGLLSIVLGITFLVIDWIVAFF